MANTADGGGGGGTPNNWGAPDPSTTSRYSFDADYTPTSDQLPMAEGDGGLYYRDINAHYPAVMAEDPDSISTAADGWRAVASSLTAAAATVRRHGTTLEGQWESPQAKEAFLLKVGMLAASMDDWASKASTNATTLDTLHSTVKSRRERMRTLWFEFDG